MGDNHYMKQFQILETLGKGNFGTVYRVNKNGEEEALKVLNIYSQNSDFNEILGQGNTSELETKTKKMMDEISMLYRLKGNTHIVNYIDHYVDKKADYYTLYLEMELLNSLDKYYPDDIDTDQILKICYDILDGLILCEDENIVHGDIKPQNLMVDDQGHHKLTDFGISKIMSGEKGINGYTPAYAAPEVISERKYSQQSDLYSLGLVIYQLFNNNLLPFMNENMTKKEISGMIQKRIEEELPEPANGEEEFNQFLKKALEKEPQKRYQTAKEMKEELKRLQEGNHIPKILVSLPIVIALASKLNITDVYGATPKAVPQTKVSIIDKLKHLSMTTKIICGVAATLVIGGIGYGALSQKGNNLGNSQLSYLAEYDDLSVEDMYAKVIEHMNKEIHYMRYELDTGTYHYDYDKYVIDGKIQWRQIIYMHETDNDYVNVTIDNGQKLCGLSTSKEEPASYSEHDIDMIENYKAPETILFYNFMTNENTKILDCYKEEKNNQIIIYTKRKIENADPNEMYQQIITTIGSSGYVEKEEITAYSDENFKNEVYKMNASYSDFNKRTEKDLINDVNNLKEFEGMSYDEVCKKIR